MIGENSIESVSKLLKQATAQLIPTTRALTSLISVTKKLIKIYKNFKKFLISIGSKRMVQIEVIHQVLIHRRDAMLSHHSTLTILKQQHVCF